MATLNIYDKFGGLLETHIFYGSLTAWMQENVASYKDSCRPPYSAKLNGGDWPYIHHDAIIESGDVVDLTVEPADPITIALTVIAVVSAAYAYYVAQNIDTDYQNSAQRGANIYNPNARANSVKPSGVIRACAGSYPIFPDYICPPRRKFIDHEEFIYLMMSVTDGYMLLRDKNVYISETPIINYSGDYTLSIFDPGDNVTGHEAHENWYTTREISGLELITSTNEIPGVWTATYAGDTITSFLDGSLTEFPFPADATIEITSGTNQGFYKVVSVGSPSHTATVLKQSRDENENIIIDRTASQAAALAGSRRLGGFLWGSGATGTGAMLVDSTASPQTALVSVSPREAITWRALNGGINWEGPFELIPVNETCRYLEIDVNFPAGLVTLDSGGEETANTVEIAIEYRAVGDNTWTQAIDTSRSPNTTIYTAATLNERGYTVEVDMLSAIRPEIRIRRVTKDSETTSTRNNSYIRRVKALLETPTSYPKVSTMALSLRGTNALASTSENKINIRGATRKLPTLQEVQDAAAGTPFDLSAATTQTVSESDRVNNTAAFIGATDLNLSDYYPTTNGTANSVHFSPDGLNLLTFENGVLRAFTCAKAFEPKQGLTYNGYSTTSATVYGKNAMWADSGSKIITIQKASDPNPYFTTKQFALSTPYDITTIGIEISSFTTSGEVSSVENGYISNDGAAFWLAGSAGVVVQYTLSTPWDFGTISQDMIGSPQTAVSFDTSAELNTQSPNADLAAFWLEDYTGASPARMWVIDDSGVMYDYTMSTPGDISTCSNDSTITLVSGLASIETIQVTANYLHVCTFPGETFVNTYLLDDTSDSRASKSLLRFAALELYNALGSDVADVVDWTAFSSIDSILESRGDYFNGEFVDETTLWEAVKLLLLPGYCEPAMKEGKLTPVRTSTGTDYTHLYTPDFMLGEGLTITDDHYDGQDPDGIDVEYLDADSGENEIIECRLSGDLGLRPKRIKAIGITDSTRAWRYGMRQRREIFEKPANYIFNTEMDGLNSEYGDAIGIASDIFSSQSGTVTAISGANVTLDFSPTYDTSISPMPAYFAAFKKPNGGFSGLYTITMGSPNNVIVITDSPGIDFTPVTDASPDSDGENTLVAIGTASEWGVRAIVRKVAPQDDSIVQLIAQEYVANIYADDDNSPP